VIEEALPVTHKEINALVPYSQASLVARAHAAGDVLRVEHGPDGTLLAARVPADLAAELEPFEIVATPIRA
jgi:GTP-binding protein HflX